MRPYCSIVWIDVDHRLWSLWKSGFINPDYPRSRCQPQRFWGQWAQGYRCHSAKLGTFDDDEITIYSGCIWADNIKGRRSWFQVRSFRMGQCADLNGRQTMAYVEVVSTVVLLFDFCITFDSEVRWTWGRKWEIMRITFVISRYLPIASVAMYLYYNVQSLQRGIPNPGMFIVVDGSCIFNNLTLELWTLNVFC